MYYKYMSTIIAWALFILIMTFLIFTVFSIFLNKFYSVETHQEIEDLDIKRRRLIGLFVFIALIFIMTMTGINAFMNTR